MDKDGNAEASKNIHSFSIVMGCFLLSFSVFCCGYFVNQIFKRKDLGPGIVRVKGLSEREVKSDIAIWTITFRRQEDDVSTLEKKIKHQRELVTHFLQKSNLESQIDGQSVQVHEVREYKRVNGDEAPVVRYEAVGKITVRTSNVDQVKSAALNTIELVNGGFLISSKVDYKYTNFGALREEMLDEATQSSKRAAEQFAKNSQTQIDSIRDANQGTFTIVGADNAQGDYDYQESESLRKRIRVVTTVTFNLKK